MSEAAANLVNMWTPRGFMAVRIKLSDKIEPACITSLGLGSNLF